MSKKDDKKKGQVETTGHVWDGIEEFNNPLPRWWLWTFYGTIIWGIIYTILYPAWPISSQGATPGVLGYSSRAELQAEMDRFDARLKPLKEKIVAVDLAAIKDDPQLADFARRGGKALFATWCSQCHGSGGQGAKGYPNLLDDEWLWGGTLDAIHTTIQHGVNDEHDEDTRTSEMPAWKDQLEPAEIDNVVQYVLKISGQEHDAAKAEAGATVFADNCAACHGDDGKGDQETGAPDLTNAIWLYGGDEATIRETVENGRKGVMPSWSKRGLDEAEIRQVAFYVHSLGGGQ